MSVLRQMVGPCPSIDPPAGVNDRVNGARNRLGGKILLVMGGALLASSLACLVLLMSFYHRQLLAERQMVSSKLGAMLQITLENAMLKRDLDGLRDIVGRLGRSENVSGVEIVNPEGEVRFSSHPDRVGQRYPGLAGVCPSCGLGGDKEETGAAFVRDERGNEVLRSVNVVANREACVGCHGAVASHPVNGLLVVDYAAADLKRHAAWTAALLGAIGLTVVLAALAATWLALRKLVFVPVDRITSASRAIAAGDLGARVELAPTGTDEMTALGRQFDAMATQLQDTVATLRERDLFLQALIDAVPDGIRLINEDFSVAAANKAFCDQVGLAPAEVLAQPCYASSHRSSEPCVPTMVVCPVRALQAESGPIKCMHTHVDGRTGDPLAVEVIAAPLEIPTRAGPRRCVVESVRDLRRQIEVSQEQRLSEIGLLATGVAHEIHNPLCSIRLGLGAIRRRVRPEAMDAEMAQYLAMIDVEIDRCIEVTGRLMWISQPPGERGELVDIDVVVRDVVALLHYEATTRKLDVTTDISPSARIVASSREIGMVLLNLVQNAFHACREGGRITVAATVREEEVCIVVTDTGVGIAEEDLEKVFYPFWSRRADGSAGSGLGLSICQSIVQKWNGRIGVDSRRGEGTRFRLTFPCAEKVVALR
ncbi:MAG: HAMP domain-containing protein [Hyphomicrobiales bacterium]|nr:HAMP domain-containing protein [Hyphomicrobiales bacterium]